jgi:glycosyltransferase involved in cell wall biosynthesis
MENEVRKLVSIVMPALNEAPGIELAVFRIPKAEFAALGFDTEILVVDNGSMDGTAELARKAGARVIYEPQRGYGNALLAGFREAKGKVICTLDADCSYPASILPELVDRLVEERLDFINTNRLMFLYNDVMPRTTRLGNAILSLTSRILFRLPFHDSQSGMWVFRSELLGRMQIKSAGMPLSQEIKIEAACRLKSRCAEFPIHYGYRYGTPKIRVWRDGFGNLFSLFRKRLTWRN